MMTVLTIEIKVENIKFYLPTGHIKRMLFPSFKYGGWKSELEVLGRTTTDNSKEGSLLHLDGVSQLLPLSNPLLQLLLPLQFSFLFPVCLSLCEVIYFFLEEHQALDLRSF